MGITSTGSQWVSGGKARVGSITSKKTPTLGSGTKSNPYIMGQIPGISSSLDEFSSSSNDAGTSLLNTPDILNAMEETQDRAASDRGQALQEIKDARARALDQYGNVSPEVISQKAADMMFGKARDTAEADRASILRQLQTTYYSGSMPSGSIIQKASEIDMAKMGTLAKAKSSILTDMAKTNWQGAFDLAKQKAGIETSMVNPTVETLSNTIAAVPKMLNLNNASKSSKDTSGKDRYGRLPGEMNVDFLRRDPAGYQKWYSATSK